MSRSIFQVFQKIIDRIDDENYTDPIQDDDVVEEEKTAQKVPTSDIVPEEKESTTLDVKTSDATSKPGDGSKLPTAKSSTTRQEEPLFYDDDIDGEDYDEEDYDSNSDYYDDENEDPYGMENYHNKVRQK